MQRISKIARFYAGNPLTLPALLLCLLVTTIGFYTSHALRDYSNASDGAVVLPLRIIGPDGYTVSADVQVDDPSNIDSLYVQAHNLSYEGEGSVRINGGSWIELNNDVVSCAYPERALGCIGGAYSTIRFTLPIDGVVAGANTIEFRHNYESGNVSAGYRVLKFNFLRANGNKALPPSTFEQDDPSAWEPPYSDQSSIDEGEQLWNNASLVDFPGGPSIQATCSGCHAEDGQDLKYFNYSNHAIVARSEFHGLTQTEGNKIASYIRAIQLKKEDGTSYEAPGTPWDPPYQPGPTLMATGESPDASDQVYWAAGAGLEWALDRDSEAMEYLWPNGINWQRADPRGTLNMRELPVALQMPDWNQWLPQEHPLDIEEADFADSPARNHYVNNHQGPKSLNKWKQYLNRLMGWTQDFRRSLSPGAFSTTAEHDKAVLDVQQWGLVKSWETMHGEHLEDKAPALYGTDKGEARSWIGSGRLPFNLSPHIGKANCATCQPYTYGSLIKEAYFNHAWYELEVILNAGNRSAGKVHPVDWKYQRNFTSGFSTVTGVPAMSRYIASFIKVMQQAAKEDESNNPGGSGGWGPREHHPQYIGRLYFETGHDEYRHMRNPSTTAGEKTAITEALLRAFMKYQLSEFGPTGTEEYPRGEGSQTWEGPEAIPSPPGGPLFWNNRRLPHNDNVYRGVIAFDSMGVASSLVDTLATWGNNMWPADEDWPAGQLTWEELVNPSGSEDPIATITNLADGNTFTAPVDLTVEADAYDPDSSGISHVTFFADGTELGEDASAPYSFTWQDVSAGQYTLTAQAVDDQGNTGSSAPVAIVVVDEGTETTQSITLQQGWNFISSHVRPRAPSLDSVFAATPDLAVVRGGGAGQVYVPGAHNNNLSQWSLLESYLVFMQDSDTLRVTGQSDPCETTTIPLQEGWNFIPYLCDQPMTPTQAFAGIADDLVRVKDGAGNEYLPAQNLDGIGMLQPGQGYKAYVSEDASLVYPAPQPQQSNDGSQQRRASSAVRRR